MHVALTLVGSEVGRAAMCRSQVWHSSRVPDSESYFLTFYRNEHANRLWAASVNEAMNFLTPSPVFTLRSRSAGRCLGWLGYKCGPCILRADGLVREAGRKIQMDAGYKASAVLNEVIGSAAGNQKSSRRRVFQETGTCVSLSGSHLLWLSRWATEEWACGACPWSLSWREGGGQCVPATPVFLSQVEMGFLRSLCYLFFVWWEKEEEGKIRV